MTVGLPHRPSMAGNGGLARTTPRLPSMLSISAVSSPQMYAPAPTRTCSRKTNSLPITPATEPAPLSQPRASQAAIATCMASMASGYSLRMYT